MTRSSRLAKQFWIDFRAGYKQANTSWLDYFFLLTSTFPLIVALNVFHQISRNGMDRYYAAYALRDTIVALLFFIPLLTIKLQQNDAIRSETFVKSDTFVKMVVVCVSGIAVLAFCLPYIK